MIMVIVMYAACVLVIYGLVTATLWLTGKRPDFLPGRPS
jgi:hypothetical protein